MHCKICDKEDAKYIDEDWYCEECQDWQVELMDEYEDFDFDSPGWEESEDVY